MLMPDEGGGGGGGGGGGAPGGGAPGGAPSGGSVESSVGRAGNAGSSATQADVSGGEEDWGGFESLDAIELGDDGGAATQPPIEPRRDAPPAPRWLHARRPLRRVSRRRKANFRLGQRM